MTKIKKTPYEGQTTSIESYLTGDHNQSQAHSEGYACEKFSDPYWIKANIEYFPTGFAHQNGVFKNISPEETVALLKKGSSKSKFTIIDVKTEQEFLQTHLHGALHIDFFSSTFKDDLFNLDKTMPYIIICKIGVRSEITMNLMKKMGFQEVYNVIGGDERWEAEKLPQVRSSKTACPCS